MMAGHRRKLIDLEAMQEAAECLKTLAHPHRLRMIEMLLNDEYTVGQLAKTCGIQSHMASEHLRLMKDRGFLASRRDGRCTYYRIADSGLSAILGCVENRFGGRKRRQATGG